MGKRKSTDFLFAANCFNRAKKALRQIDQSPQKRMIAALESVSSIVVEDLPMKAHDLFTTVSDVTQSTTESGTSRVDKQYLQNAVENMDASELEKVQTALLSISSYVDNSRREALSSSLNSAAVGRSRGNYELSPS